jgi:hypothetical protein
MNRRNSGKPEPKKESPWVAWLALVIAILGGVPGLISTADYFKRSSLKIQFDAAQSLACGLQTDNTNLINKLAIVLYRINVTGGGLQPAFVRDLKIEARINKKWIIGSHIAPKLFDEKDLFGNVVKAVLVKWRQGAPLLVKEAPIHLVHWNEKWNEIGTALQYGEPLNFSYAAFFDVDQSQFQYCDRIKLVVTDYLGHEYTTLVEPNPLMKQGYSDKFLVLDGD